jgi:hypothetical protein
MELVLFYQSAGQTTGCHLESRLVHLSFIKELEVFRSIASLATRLQHPADDLTAIILAASREELQELQTIRRLLSKARVFLLVGDEEDETIALAHRLRPRFLGYLNDDYSEIFSVLVKMLAEQIYLTYQV